MGHPLAMVTIRVVGPNVSKRWPDPITKSIKLFTGYGYSLLSGPTFRIRSYYLGNPNFKSGEPEEFEVGIDLGTLVKQKSDS